MLELLCFLLLASSSTGAPVTLKSSTPSQMTTSAPVYQASSNSLHGVEGLIEDTSNSLVNLDHDHAGSVSEDSSFISLPSSSASIPPRFKYMEEQIAQKKDDLVDVEYSTTEDHTSVSPDSSTSFLPPRYDYMEEQVVYEKEVFEEDSESSSVTHPTTTHITVKQSIEVTSEKISTSSEVPTTFSLPPRFKYMEEQLAHKKQDLEENYEASRETMSTTVPAMGDQRTEEMLISPEVSTSFPIPPRFKYMEVQISESQESEEEKMPELDATTSYPITPSPTTSHQTTISTESSLTPTIGSQTTPRIPYPEHEESLTDTVELHKQNPFLSGGSLPGPAGFVKKTKRVSEEEKQRMIKEMEVQYGPVMEDIKEYGFILKRENDKLSAEVQVLRGELLIKTESELVDVKLKKQMSWLPFWN